MGETCAIHANQLPHQKHYAEAVKRGLKRHGYEAFITGFRGTDADVHVCIGPWFAYNRWRFNRTLYLDRAYWGDPDSVSLHWLRGGEKAYTEIDAPRFTPRLQPMRDSTKSIYLCDYNQKPDIKTDAVRLHPANGQTGDLVSALDGFGVAAGRRTTALVDAAIHGLGIRCNDPHSPVYALSQGLDRTVWINRLAWHNWTHAEIENGDFLDAIGHN